MTLRIFVFSTKNQSSFRSIIDYLYKSRNISFLQHYPFSLVVKDNDLKYLNRRSKSR